LELRVTGGYRLPQNGDDERDGNPDRVYFGIRAALAQLPTVTTRRLKIQSRYVQVRDFFRRLFQLSTIPLVFFLVPILVSFSYHGRCLIAAPRPCTTVPNYRTLSPSASTGVSVAYRLLCLSLRLRMIFSQTSRTKDSVECTKEYSSAR